MSRQFLGIQIDAVYHTAIVFGGVEYLFGQGVQTCIPGSTHHGKNLVLHVGPRWWLIEAGNPIEIIPIGRTSLPEDVIAEYLESLKEIYTAEVCRVLRGSAWRRRLRLENSPMTCSCTTATTFRMTLPCF